MKWRPVEKRLLFLERDSKGVKRVFELLFLGCVFAFGGNVANHYFIFIFARNHAIQANNKEDGGQA